MKIILEKYIPYEDGSQNSFGCLQYTQQVTLYDKKDLDYFLQRGWWFADREQGFLLMYNKKSKNSKGKRQEEIWWFFLLPVVFVFYGILSAVIFTKNSLHLTSN